MRKIIKMKRIDEHTFIVGGNTIIRTQQKNTPMTEPHSTAKLTDSSELGNEAWCDWGNDNLYPYEANTNKTEEDPLLNISFIAQTELLKYEGKIEEI